MRDYGTLKRLGMGDAPPTPDNRICTLCEQPARVM